MGLLDDFANALPNFLPDDPQKREAAKMGLINFGAQMLANANHGFGSALGSGLAGGAQSYNGQLEQQQKMALQTQQAKTLGLDYDIKKLAVDKQKQLTDAYKQFYGQQPAPSSAPAMPVAPAAPSAPIDNTAFPRQALPAWMPQAQAQAQTSAQPAGASATPSMANDNYLRHLQFAQYLDKQGLGEEAQKYYDLADKFKPKLKEQKVLNDGNGNIVTANVYEDGRTEVVPGFKPAEKLHFANTGGETVGLDQYTGKKVAGVKNTQSPDSVASNSVAWANYNVANRRLNNDIANQNQPTFNQELGGFITKPTSQNPNGGIIPLAGFKAPDKPLTESQGKATAFASRMLNADKLINGLVESGTKTPSLIKQTLEGVPLIGNSLGMAANGFANTGQQQMEQAQRDFVNAILRQESGASISPDEFSNARKQYFPTPGDDAETIRQKANNRRIAIEGMRVQSGAGAGKIDSILSVSSEPTMKMPQSKMFKLDGGGSVGAKLGTDGNYYVERNGKKYRVAE